IMSVMPPRKAPKTVTINRAPVLTLWASVVAERLGFGRDEALTLGKAVAGLNAYSKGRALGIYKPSTKEPPKRKARMLKEGATLYVDLLHRAVPARQTDDGIRAVNRDRVITTKSVEKYLDKKFGDNLDAVRDAMTALAKALGKAELADCAYELYEAFRPVIPAGKRGWGAAGKLDLGRIRSLAE
ncbi:MAG: hypothetical protein ACYSW1_05195, partial [Planctomycetota bacterium]